MEQELSLEFLRVVEEAAIASARTMGLGDGHKSDQAAVEAMRKEMDTVSMDGTIVIGEGERDKAPMLFIGEHVGLAARDRKHLYPAVDIAVDPLEGTNLARAAHRTRSRCSRRATKVGSSTLPTFIWRRLSWGPCAGAQSISMHTGAQPESDRQAARPQGERFGSDRARTAAARKAGSGYSQDRSARPADPGWRPFGRY